MNETQHVNRILCRMRIMFVLITLVVVVWLSFIGELSGTAGIAFVLAAGALLVTQTHRVIDNLNHEKQHAKIVAILERIADASQQSHQSTGELRPQ